MNLGSNNRNLPLTHPPLLICFIIPDDRGLSHRNRNCKPARRMGLVLRAAGIVCPIGREESKENFLMRETVKSADEEKGPERSSLKPLETTCYHSL